MDFLIRVEGVVKLEEYTVEGVERSQGICPGKFEGKPLTPTKF